LIFEPAEQQANKLVVRVPHHGAGIAAASKVGLSSGDDDILCHLGHLESLVSSLVISKQNFGPVYLSDCDTRDTAELKDKASMIDVVLVLHLLETERLEDMLSRSLLGPMSVSVIRPHW
jgi:hypothetical protein